MHKQTSHRCRNLRLCRHQLPQIPIQGRLPSRHQTQHRRSGNPTVLEFQLIHSHLITMSHRTRVSKKFDPYLSQKLGVNCQCQIDFLSSWNKVCCIAQFTHQLKTALWAVSAVSLLTGASFRSYPIAHSQLALSSLLRRPMVCGRTPCESLLDTEVRSAEVVRLSDRTVSTKLCGG